MLWKMVYWIMYPPVDPPDNMTCLCWHHKQVIYFIAVCETSYEEHKVSNMVPNCSEEEEEVCTGDNDGKKVCKFFPRQKCVIENSEETVRTPETKCVKVPVSVCGPDTCPIVQLEDVCSQKLAMVRDCRWYHPKLVACHRGCT